MSVLGQAFDWWWTGLSDCLPASLKQRSQRSERRHLLNVRENGVELQVVRGAREQEAHFFGTDSGGLRRLERRLQAARERGERVVLHAASVAPLVRNVVLPAAAEENLRQVLAFEMDRLTPYRAEDVFYHHEVVERFKDEEKLRLRLVLLPKAALAGSVERLAELNAVPDVIRVRDGQQWTDLPVDDSALRSAGKSKLVNLVLAIVCLCLLLVALSLPLAREQRLFAELQKEEAPARAAAMEAIEVRDRIQSLIASRNLLADSKSGQPSAVEVIDRLSELIPDHTWLFRFELKGSSLSIQGESDAATALIELLETADTFSDVSFSAPVQQNPRTGRERFSLTAEVHSP